jgi:hypothetical protein
VESGRLKIDGEVIRPTGEVVVTKAAVDPVWDLPGIAQRFGVTEDRLLLPAPPCEKFARLGWKITQPYKSLRDGERLHLRLVLRGNAVRSAGA